MDISRMTPEEQLSEYKAAYTLCRYLIIVALLFWFWSLYSALDYTFYYNRVQKSEPVYYHGQCISLSNEYTHMGPDLWLFELDNGLVLEMPQDNKTQFDEQHFREIMSTKLCYVFYEDKEEGIRLLGIRDGEDMLINENYRTRSLSNVLSVRWLGVFAVLIFPLVCFFGFLFYNNEYKILLKKVSITKRLMHQAQSDTDEAKQ